MLDGMGSSGHVVGLKEQCFVFLKITRVQILNVFPLYCKLFLSNTVSIKTNSQMALSKLKLVVG